MILFCGYGQAATLACYIEFLPFSTAAPIHGVFKALIEFFICLFIDFDLAEFLFSPGLQ